MEIKIHTDNIKLSPEEYILLFSSFEEKEKGKIFKSLYLNFFKVALENIDDELPSIDILEKEAEEEISDETKALLDERLEAYSQNPEQVSTWDEVKQSINEKYGYGI